MADSWRGRNDVMGILVDEKADITACSLFLTNERLSIAVPLHNTYLYRLFIDNN